MPTGDRAIRKSGLIALLLLGLLTTSVFVLLQRARRPAAAATDAPPLLFFCAAGMKAPVSEIVEHYRQETGRRVDVQFAGSGSLLANLSVGQGDLYLAADSGYLDDANERGWIAERFEIASLTPGFVVADGNPKRLSKTADLAEREGLRIGLGNPDAAAIGKVTRGVLENAGLWGQVKPRVTVFKPTVNELVTDVKLGTIDVAVGWDAVVGLVEGLEFVSTPEFDAAKRTVSFAVLSSSRHPVAALHFARFLAASDRGAQVFAKHGFAVLPGDPWADQPELVLYSGSMLRPAIEERIAQFQEREGVQVRPVYNGCGILVAQMKAGETPDAFFACDRTFLEMVEDQFESGTTVSRNRIVLLVSADVQDRVQRLEDITLSGLRIGIGHPEKSTLGKLTGELFRQTGIAAALKKSKNVVVESPTGDFLVNQWKAGGLDVAVVYLSNAHASPDTLNDGAVVLIDHPAAEATQPWAIAKDTRYPQTAARLQSWLIDAPARDAYESRGFTWER